MSSTRQIAVRPLEAAGRADVVALFQEMQAHYGVPCPSAGKIMRDLADLPPGVTILIAHADAVLGFAAVAVIYPGPGLERGLHLKELFVAEAARGTGAGRALMRAVARFAVTTGCKRVDWTADRSNTRLVGYYERLGAAAQPEKLFCRLQADALADLAGS